MSQSKYTIIAASNGYAVILPQGSLASPKGANRKHALFKCDRFQTAGALCYLAANRKEKK